jgi:NhaP-type Na+/H+ or K+/H+ antiporter
VEHHLIVGLGAIVVLGAGAQWLATRIRLPSILLLLVAGFVAGPVTGFVDPGELLGDALPALVSLAVAVILFDGGLSLRFDEVRGVREVVRRLISVGALVTVAVGTVAARGLLPLSWRMALLLATILVVSGPTVILPLLRHIQPSRNAASVVKWEGIFIDPVGAVAAVLMFEVIVAGGERQELGVSVLTGMATTALVGGLIGVGAAAVLVSMLRRFLIPHHLEIPVTVGLVVAAYLASNTLQAESGLLAVTLMGVAMANQRKVPVRHIVEFGETVGVLLTSTLFVALAADLEMAPFLELGWGIVGFIAVLVLVARPLAVALSTVGSGLTRQERVFVGWLAPRGIVAASVASVFATRLAAAGVEEAELLVPYVFTVIVAAAAIYGLTAGPLARRLGVAQPDPQGIVIVGAHPWARELARTLDDGRRRVVLVPTNRRELAAARMDGHDVHPGAILQEDALEQMDLTGIGWMLAITANEEFNSLAALRFQEMLGRERVLQLPAHRDAGEEREVAQDLRGRLAFGDDVTYGALDERFATGARLKRTKLTGSFGWEDLCRQYDGTVTPLVILRGDALEVVSRTDVTRRTDVEVVAVVEGDADAPADEADEGVDELAEPAPTTP